MTLTWSWDELATADLVAALYQAVGAPPPADTTTAQGLLSRVFAATGGLPVADSPPDLAGLARDLLAQALGAYRRRVAPNPPPLPGIALVDGDQSAAEHAVAVGEVPVNRCRAGDLAALPAVGPNLAGRIVAERRRGGLFTGPSDLVDRVDGIGPDAARRLAGCLRYDLQPTPPAAGGLADFAAQAAAATGGDPVVQTLEAVLAAVAGDPSPASAGRRRTPTTRALPDLPWIPVATTAALVNDEYTRWLPTYLAQAAVSIDVCMFHIALGRPTRPMVDALITAAGRGVAVRVLLDRDRPDDPYNSTVVNARARATLTAGGVTVRQDRAGTLLHSKYLIIDRRLVVLGSHNWSAGSFATYDDLSLGIDSPELATALQQRFDQHW